MTRIRHRFLAAVGLASTFVLGGCAYDDGYYGGVSVGSGYYGGGYYDDYWGPGYYRPGYYNGWYDGYYYPGSGYYVYDRSGHRHRWSDSHRRYWEGRREAWRRDNRDRPTSVDRAYSRPREPVVQPRNWGNRDRRGVSGGSRPRSGTSVDRAYSTPVR